MPKPKTKTRRLGRPPSSLSAETRRRIVDSAEKCFALYGYDKTTNKDIAEEAGLTTGALYHYFDSKQSLYVAVLTDRSELILERFLEVQSGQPTAIDKLCAILDSAADLNAEYPYIASFLSTASIEILRHEEFNDNRQVPLSRSAGTADIFTPIVMEGAKNGEFDPGTDPADIVNMLMAVTSGLSQFASFLQDPVAHRRVIEAFESLLRGNLVSAAGRTRSKTTEPGVLGLRRRARVS
jgi:AcrR family transcriptional regulator